MYVIGTPKAAKAFEARLQTAVRNAKLFATDAQETYFLAAANDAYMRVARKNAIKVIVLPEQFFDIHNLLRNISTSPNQNARQKLLDNPELLFTTRNIDVPKNESSVITQPPAPPLAKTPKDQKLQSKLTINMVREAVLYHLEHHDGRKPSQLTGVIEAGNPLHDGKRTWKSVDIAFSRQGMGLNDTDFKSLSNFCKRDPAIKEKTKTKLKEKKENKNNTSTGHRAQSRSASSRTS